MEQELECLDRGDSTECGGTVEYRTALSATGKSFARCEVHWDLRLIEQERINEEHPDSPVAPDWFDESNIGERWDDEY